MVGIGSYSERIAPCPGIIAQRPDICQESGHIMAMFPHAGIAATFGVGPKMLRFLGLNGDLVRPRGINVRTVCYI